MNSYDHSRRSIIVFAACVGMNACICEKNGVTQKGPLEFAYGIFFIGPFRIASSEVSSITIEPDLITIHLGPIA